MYQRTERAEAISRETRRRRDRAKFICIYQFTTQRCIIKKLILISGDQDRLFGQWVSTPCAAANARKLKEIKRNILTRSQRTLNAEKQTRTRTQKYPHTECHYVQVWSFNTLNFHSFSLAVESKTPFVFSSTAPSRVVGNSCVSSLSLINCRKLPVMNGVFISFQVRLDQRAFR